MPIKANFHAACKYYDRKAPGMALEDKYHAALGRAVSTFWNDWIKVNSFADRARMTAEEHFELVKLIKEEFALLTPVYFVHVPKTHAHMKWWNAQRMLAINIVHRNSPPLGERKCFNAIAA